MNREIIIGLRGEGRIRGEGFGRHGRERPLFLTLKIRGC
jgi:hypothetical protein